MSVLTITSDRFIASDGKLDSINNYVYQTSNPNFLFAFPTGKTIDLPVRGVVYEIDGHRFVAGNDSVFTGSFIASTV